MKNNYPIRMCIICRKRFPQNTLLRLKLEDKEIILFNGVGRSFYICKECSTKEKKIRGLEKRFKQQTGHFDKLLKEFI